MKKEKKNLFLKYLKDGIKVNHEVFKDIAHDELQLGYVIHKEKYNDIIDKYLQMDEIEEKGEKIALIYPGYSWITLEFLIKAILENSQILLVNSFNHIITGALVALIEEVCKDFKIESPIIEAPEDIYASYVINNYEKFSKIYYIGDRFEYDKYPIKEKIIYNNFSYIKLFIDKNKYLEQYKEILKTSIIENYAIEEFEDYDEFMKSYSKDDYVVIFSDNQKLIEKMQKLNLNKLCINNFSFDNYEFNIKMNDSE